MLGACNIDRWPPSSANEKKALADTEGDEQAPPSFKSSNEFKQIQTHST
jgi:hypothetical protein